MSEKIAVTYISAVAFIVRRANPAEIFMERKTSGYRPATFENTLFPLGGTWKGEAAKADRNPRDTLHRELLEELSLTSGPTSTAELRALGLQPESSSYVVPRSGAPVGKSDKHQLEALKRVIVESCLPFGDVLHQVEKSLLDSGDPRPYISPLVSYWVAALGEREWAELTALQQKFGGLSNESQTLFTSLEEIIARQDRVGFGHDRVLQQLWAAFGLTQAKDLPLIAGIMSKPLGTTLTSYAEYLEQYDVFYHP